MKCNNCGTFIEDNNICPNCSNAVQSSTINNSQQLIINQNEEIEFLDLCEKKEEKPIVKEEKQIIIEEKPIIIEQKTHSKKTLVMIYVSIIISLSTIIFLSSALIKNEKPKQVFKTSYQVL